MKLDVGFDFDIDAFREEGFRAAILAMSGGGKSYAAKVLCEELHRVKYPILIIDPEGEYASFREYCPTLIVGGNYADIALSELIVKDIIELLLSSSEPRIVIFDLNLLRESDRTRWAALIQEALFQLSSKYQRAMALVIEECHLIAPQRLRKGQSTASLEQALDIIKRGRKRGVNSIWISQRPADVDKGIISQCNLRFFGKMMEKTDHEQLKQFFKQAEITVEEVMKLKKTFYFYDGQRTQLAHFRRMTIKDLGRTPQVGEKFQLKRTKDQSLDTAIQELLKRVEKEQAKQQVRQDELETLRQQNQRLQNKIEGLQQETAEIDRFKKIAEDLRKAVSGEVSNGGQAATTENLQLLEEKISFEKRTRQLEQQLAEVQKRYDILATEFQGQQQFAKFREKLEQKVLETVEANQSLLELIRSFDPQLGPAAAFEPISSDTAQSAEALLDPQSVDWISLMQEEAIQQIIAEASKKYSRVTIEEIIGLLIRMGKATYEQLRLALGYKDTSYVSKICARLAAKKLFLQEMVNGRYEVRLDREGILEAIAWHTDLKEGKAITSKVFKKEGNQ